MKTDKTSISPVVSDTCPLEGVVVRVLRVCHTTGLVTYGSSPEELIRGIPPKFSMPCARIQGWGDFDGVPGGCFYYPEHGYSFYLLPADEDKMLSWLRRRYPQSESK